MFESGKNTVRAPRLVIAGTGSGAGKTTVTLGLMAALRRRGLTVQGFKCGPDYIDPSYHTAVTGRKSRNIDTWMLAPDTAKELFLRGVRGADISIIEGVMGLYDGKDPLSDTGSTAEIALLLESPVLLVVNAQSMARSAAAIVLGFQRMNPAVRIAGVIANKCGSAGHYRIVKAAVEQMSGIPVLGWLGRDERLSVPERHLGLVPAIERGELQPLFDNAAELILQGVELEALLELANAAPALQWPERLLFGGEAVSAAAEELRSAGTDLKHLPDSFGEETRPDGLRERQAEAGDTSLADRCRPVIAVAKDAAFNFYYPENLELLEMLGASLVTYSPLAGEPVPAHADGVYIGGGFPEEFAARLSAHTEANGLLKRLAEGGMPLFAECGGYMYLTRTITDRSGRTYPMAGLIPANVRMQPKLAALGYREVKAARDNLLLPAGETIRGHEFHYSVLTPDAEAEEGYPYAYETKGLRGAGSDGFSRGSVTAGYTHVHFASNVGAARRFVERCAAYGQERREAIVRQ